MCELRARYDTAPWKVIVICQTNDNEFSLQHSNAFSGSVAESFEVQYQGFLSKVFEKS